MTTDARLDAFSALADEFDLLRSTHCDFVDACDAWASERRDTLVAGKAAHAKAVAANRLQRTQIAKDIESLNDASRELNALDAAEQNVEALRAKVVEDLEKKLCTSQTDRDALAESVAAMEREVQARKAALESARNLRLQSTKRSLPEALFYEEKLGLKIISLEPDVLRFVFTNIDKSNYSREFWFVLDVSGEREYKLRECNPATPMVEAALEYLNETRDFYRFLKEMRQGFKTVFEGSGKNSTAGGSNDTKQSR
ncbi:kinetochore-associated Ndc80 complex subunit spc25 [Entophlyctis luteolus]|nr:kinetochore-associated Ndc80 complex subunit spc25 [Entophlyctis luteolus]